MAQPSTAQQLGRPALPTELTTFVGRRAEMSQITDLLGERRLVTITGSGGSGKTRLALEALTRRADRWPDGVGWVDLGPVSDPSRVPDLAAAAIGVMLDPTGGPVRALTGQLRDLDLGLGLDNCEHLLDACADLVDALLRGCPGVTVLATSRQPLGVRGETVWRVPPMAEAEAVELFGDRARLVAPTFVGDEVDREAVSTVCRRLDGMPLAIELAAAWVRMLTPAQISSALDDRFRLLVGGPRGAIHRQQTLAASVEWSHQLLSDDARALLRRLAVFSGGFTLEAAEAVCGFGDLPPEDVLGVLGGLVDSSMVVVSDRDGFARYRLLETIRDYAADRLAAADEAKIATDRHVDHFLALAEARALQLDHEDQDPIFAELEREHDNLRAAVQRALSRPDPERGRRLAVALSRLWLEHSHAHEGIQFVQAAIDAAPEDQTTLQADLYAALALLGLPGGRLELSDEASRRSVELAEAAGDDRSLARAYAASLHLPFYTDYARAEELGRRAQRHAEAVGETFARDYALLLEACSYMSRDRHDESMASSRTLLERTAPRHDRFCASFALSLMLHTATLTGDLPQAMAWGAEAIRIAQPLNDYFVLGTNSINLAWTLGVAGEVDAGWQLIEPVVRSIESAGPDVDAVGMVLNVGRLLLWKGDFDGAVDWLGRGTRFASPDTENWISVRAIPELSGALRRLGRIDEAGEWAERGIGVARRLGTPHAEAAALEALALVVTGDDPGRAEDLHHQALGIRVEYGVRTYMADSLDALAGLAAGAERWDKGARLLAASDAARGAMGYPRLAIDRSDHDALLATIEAGFGPDGLAGAWAEGTAMTLDDAVAYATRSRGPRGRPASGWASLTPAERQVVGLVAEGLTNPEIAGRLFVSRATVKTHLSHIFAKLGVANRAELASIASTADADSR